MCVSTGNAGIPNACTITTPAVLWPTPGSVSSISRSAGTRPPCSATRRLARAERFLAFCGASPQLRISRSIVATGRRASASGVGARAKSAGVTWLTRTSVHCAESTTETSSVKGSSCRRGIGGSG
jgi:hypothetical protein